MTTLTHPAALRLQPARADRPERASILRLAIEAIRDGLAAAHLHNELQRKGVPSAEAAARAVNQIR
jgi:hypothetical protein